MPLVDFIRTHEREIIDEFEAFARVLVPVAAASMTAVELRDHAHELLTVMVGDLAEGTPARSFALVSTKAMPSGIILSTYKVAGPLKTG